MLSLKLSSVLFDALSLSRNSLLSETTLASVCPVALLTDARRNTTFPVEVTSTASVYALLGLPVPDRR